MDSQLFYDPQHDFVSEKSCMIQLLTVLELWTKMVDSYDPLPKVNFNFQKAFDSLLHQRLLANKSAYRINSKGLGWIQRFLTDCKHCVMVNISLSTWLEVLSSIPQESTIGSKPSFIFIND